jgi:hypothetical protein
VNVVTLPATTATLAHTIPLSVLGMDYAPPEEAIGQRLLLRADTPCPTCGGDGHEGPATGARQRDYGRSCSTCDGEGVLGAVVASCTLAAVVPIVKPRTGDCGKRADHVCEMDGSLVLMRRGMETLVTHERPYSDFSPTGPCPYCGSLPGPPNHVYGERKCCPDCRHPQRYAWLIEDVKATTDRCPRGCERIKPLQGDKTFRIRQGEGAMVSGGRLYAWVACPTCRGDGACPPVPMPGHPGELTEATWPTT